MKKNLLNSVILLVTLSAVFVSCNKQGDTRDEIGLRDNAKVTIKMVDAPGDYDAVNVSIIALTAIYADGSEYDFQVNSSVYDLLSLSGGTSATLVNGAFVPPGELTKLILNLGTSNTLVVNGQTFPLTVTDGGSLSRPGHSVSINKSLTQGTEYEFVLDFNVDGSITTNENGYLMSPIIRVSISTESGIIEGAVFPANTPTLVQAVSGSTKISAYTNGTTGLYSLYGIPQGNYTLTFIPKDGLGYTQKVVENVTVTNGEIKTVPSVDYNN